MASMRKRGDLQWTAHVRRRGLPAGQCKTSRTRAKAETSGKQAESEIDHGVFVSRVEIEATFAEALERYLREITRPKDRLLSRAKRTALSPWPSPSRSSLLSVY